MLVDPSAPDEQTDFGLGWDIRWDRGQDYGIQTLVMGGEAQADLSDDSRNRPYEEHMFSACSLESEIGPNASGLA